MKNDINNQKPYELFTKLQPQIKKIINGIIDYNIYTKEDYMQEAFLACLQAEKTYKRIKNKNRVKMQLPVFAYWFIQKKLYKMADTGEVVFEIYSPDGEFIETLKNGQFRKKKKELEKQGFKIRSNRITRLYETNFENHNNGSYNEDHSDTFEELDNIDIFNQKKS